MKTCIENKTYDEMDVGDSASVTHALTKRDIQLFAVMSGDVNPAHVDEEYARSDMFREIIGHGMWSASLISTVLGTQLPGPGTIYLDQSLKFLKPVMLGDSITAQVSVKEKQAKGRVLMDCRCINQEGKEVVAGEALVIAPTEKVRRERVALPQVELTESKPPLYQRLLGMSESFEPMKTAVVHPVEGYSLSGAIEAAKEGIIDPVLVGPEEKIRETAKQLGLDLQPHTIVPTKHSHEAAEKAVAMAKRGEVEALMKGKLATEELMSRVVDREQGIRTARRMSHVFCLDVKTYPRPLFITDAALNIEPKLMEKKDIVQNAIDLFQTIGLGMPKVAILSAVETVNERLPSTLDATALCKMADRGQINGGILDGPLAFDNAVSEEAAKIKGLVSPVAGRAEIGRAHV